MFRVLLQDGVVECNSPKNRKRLYKMLQEKGIRFTSKVIGHTKGRGFNLCRWVGGATKAWDIPRIAKWIAAKRLLSKDVEKACKDWFPFFSTNQFKLDKIRDAWALGWNVQQIHDLILAEWGEALVDYKWTPFDRCFVRKTIARIRLNKK